MIEELDGEVTVAGFFNFGQTGNVVCTVDSSLGRYYCVFNVYNGFTDNEFSLVVFDQKTYGRIESVDLTGTVNGRLTKLVRWGNAGLAVTSSPWLMSDGGTYPGGLFLIDGAAAEVTDAHEAAWQQVQKEATQELIDRQAHDSFLVAVGGVSPAEADLAVGEGDQSAVGDADAMGVSAEVAQGMFRSAERSLGVDHPVVTEQDSEPGDEAARLGERCEMTVELELAFSKRDKR